jgi:hypothetical protein
MNTSKPEKLIQLLSDIIVETDKPTIGKIYVDIAAETLKTEFLHDPQHPFIGIVYKHLIRLSIKDFVHSEQSAESKETVKEVIGILNSTSVITR